MGLGYDAVCASTDISCHVYSIFLYCQGIQVARFIEGGSKSVNKEINVMRLNEYYHFYDVWVNPRDLGLYVDDPTCLVFTSDLSSLVYWYRFFSLIELRQLCRSHGIKHGRQTKSVLATEMHNHDCLDKCRSLVYIFKSLPRPCRHVSKFFVVDDEHFQFSYIPPAPRDQPTCVQQVNDAPRDCLNTGPPFEPGEDTLMSSVVDRDGYDHLKPLDRDKKGVIIREWQQEMGLENRALVVCAVCAVRVAIKESVYIHANDIDLTLLRNDNLPCEVLPSSYNFPLYGRAILNPRGLEFLDRLGQICLCHQCHISISSLNVPKFALSNWMYYGHESLPEDARTAFKNASMFEKMLISRARANTITCRFNMRKEDDAGHRSDSILN